MKLVKGLGLVALMLLLIGPAWASSVTFQIDMSVQETLGNFNAESDIVVVRGSFNGWAGNDQQVTLDGEIYTGTFDIDDGNIEYKYVIVPGEGDDVWESIGNRTATISGDTVLDLVYFNDNNGQAVPVEVLFSVDMQVQILNGNFDPDADLIVVRGGHDNLGQWGGAVALERQTGSDVYALWIQFDDVSAGQAVEYKFVMLDNGDESQATWESVDNRSFAPTGNEEDQLPPPNGNGYGEIVPDTPYFSGVSPDDILTQDLMVHFIIDVRPAYLKIADPDSFIVDVQTGDTVWTIDEVDVAGFFNNWPWGSFEIDHQANDEGIAPDETADDQFWSADIQFYPGDPKVLIYKYGINGYDVEAGFAENHESELLDEGGTFVINDIFGSNGHLYDPYMSVREIPNVEVPTEFVMVENYPNPFNPSTNIRFSIPNLANTVLRVYNIQGQEVFVHDAGELNTGSYEVTFDAGNLASGLYFVKVEAGAMHATHRMMLVK